MTRILGVDPGARFVGLCVVERPGGDVVWHREVDRHALDANRLCDWAQLAGACVMAAATSERVDAIGIEDYNPPSPHVGRIDPRPVAAAAYVTGWLIAIGDRVIRPDATIVIPPGGHASAPASSYPPPLRRAGNHCRAAYDIAGVAWALHRTKDRG